MPLLIIIPICTYIQYPFQAASPYRTRKIRAGYILESITQICRQRWLNELLKNSLHPELLYPGSVWMDISEIEPQQIIADSIECGLLIILSVYRADADDRFIVNQLFQEL